MKALRKALRYPPTGGAVISLLTLGVLLILRALGWLQRPELLVYDEFVRWRAEYQGVAESRIVICGMTAKDLVKHGYPLDDAKFATLLENIVAAEPCVVGLDLYRDLKEPRSGELYPRLEQTLRHLDKVIAIERIPSYLAAGTEAAVAGVPAPPALADQPERVAPNNLPMDYDGGYRRAYLCLEAGLAEPRDSFALELARIYLATHQVQAELVKPEGATTPLLRLGKTTFPRLTPDAGAYSGANIHDYEILIDYRAPQNYRTFTVDDLLEKRVPPGALKDAIVIVGVIAENVKDNSPTPVNNHLRGPVHHAMIINQLLRSALNGDPPTTWWSEPAKIAWIGLCTFLGGALALAFRSPWKFAPALVLLLSAILGAGWIALLHALWIPITTPALGAFAAATFVMSFVVFLEDAERQAMRTLFSRHVSKDVMDVLWAERERFLDGGRLKPNRVTGTVLFTDLKDYSTLSEAMDPADLMTWSNEYMGRIAPHVDGHGGIVTSYRGDGMMAVFGAPFPHTSEQDIDRDATHAVECALAMRQELKELNLSWAERGMPTMAMRIGIYTGPVVTGSIGSMQRLEYAVLGDTTNTAARLEALGKELEDDETTAPCTILIGDPTCQRLRGRFATKLVGSKRLKGKAKEVIVHSVLAAVTQIPPI